MKKFLSCCLVVMLLVAVSASALSWSAGDGFIAFEGESYSNKTEIGPSPVEFTDNGNSVDVKQGGYYDGATINAGVRTNEKVGLDGLEVEVKFAKAPIATVDCWFAIHLMQKPELFNTGKMAENMGYVNLIRFGDPKLEMYEQIAFAGKGSSEIGANDNIFAIKTGDTLTMKVRFEYGQYIVSYDHNGKTYEVPAENTIQLSEQVFADDGMAHVVVTGSLLGAESDWEYTVTVKEGASLSEEQKAGAAFEKSKKVKADEIAANLGQIESFLAVATSAVEGLNYADDEAIVEAFAAIDAAKAEIDVAKADLAAAADDAGIEAAVAKAGAAVGAARAASEAVEANAAFLEEVGEEPAEDEEPVEDVDVAEEPEAEGGSMLPIIIVVVVVVVVIVVAAIALGKKKKQ